MSPDSTFDLPKKPRGGQAGTLRCSANEEGLHHPSCFPGDEAENWRSRTAGSNWPVISMGMYNYMCIHTP